MVRNTCAGAGQRFVSRKRAGGIIAALAFMSAGVHAAEWKVAPRLDLGESYTDNVTLAPSSSAKSDWITQVTPGISIEGSGSRLRLKADYALQNLVYANESSRNSFYHQLNASANATLVENTLFLDARGNIQQQATSLLAPISNNNLNPGNVTDVSSYSLSPYLLHKFGSTAVGELRFTHDAVNTQVGGLSDNSANKVDLKLNNGPSFYDLGWGVSYTQEKVDYALLPDTNSKVVTGNISYRLFSKFRILASLGREKNNYLYSGGQDPSGIFWSGGVSWTPNALSNLSASTGERYFGKTYSLQFSNITPHANWVVSYNQDITSMRQEIQNPYLSPYLRDFQNMVVDYYASQGIVRSEQQIQEDALGLAGEFFGMPTQVLTNQLYLSKQLIGSVAIRYGKSDVTLTANRSERKAVTTGAVASLYVGDLAFQANDTTKQYGLNGQWDIRMSPRNTANIGLNFSRYAFPTLSRADNYRSIKLGMTRKLEKKVTGSVSFLHSLRDSSLNENDYTQNAISGHLLWMF